jgi:endonuclease YncB( thermonuclease family)
VKKRKCAADSFGGPRFIDHEAVGIDLLPPRRQERYDSLPTWTRRQSRRPERDFSRHRTITMNVLSIRAALLAVALVSLFSSDVRATPQMVRVVRVVDGRTLVVTTAAGESVITLAGVDLRPADETLGLHSRPAELLSALLRDRWVLIEREERRTETTSSPSFWVYRSPDGLDISREIIRRGMALPTRQPCSRAADLLEAEREGHNDVSSGWNDSAPSSVPGQHTPMTYLGTIDPPHLRREKSGALTTRTTTVRPKPATRSPLVVVIDTNAPPQ